MNSPIIFMTGATSGLGKVSALNAAINGAAVIVLARNQSKAAALAHTFETRHPESSGRIEIVHGNLSSLSSIQSACQNVVTKYPVIDVLVNNAGIMNFEHIETEDGIEETLQVNLIAPILICHLLFKALQKSNSPKIIFTSSALHQGTIQFHNLEFNNDFSSFKSYRQSKLGVILCVKYLSQVWKSQHISIYALHPGMVNTNLGRNAGWFSKLIFSIMGKSAEKGAETLTHLITTPNKDLKTGEYYADKKVTATTKESYDMEVAKKLMNRINLYLIDFNPDSIPV